MSDVFIFLFFFVRIRRFVNYDYLVVFRFFFLGLSGYLITLCLLQCFCDIKLIWVFALYDLKKNYALCVYTRRTLQYFTHELICG